MDAETFRWIFGGLAGVIIILLGMQWKSLGDSVKSIQMSVRSIQRAVDLDLRGLAFRVARLEEHAGLDPPLIHLRRHDDKDEDTLS